MGKVDILRSITLRTGKYTLFLAILAVALHFWGVLSIDKVRFPHFIDFLYIYIILNGAAASTFIYLEKRAKVATEAVCPKCKGPLETITNYRCANCGNLEFKKEATTE